jgi:hypothetical protein
MDDLLRALDPLFKKEVVSIEVFGLFDLDEALVFGDGSREPTPTLLELGRAANNPAHDSGVRNHNGALRHNRGQISVAQLVRDVPPHTHRTMISASKCRFR